MAPAMYCLLLLLRLTLCREETVLLVEVARHGSRAPVNIGGLQMDWFRGLNKGDITPVGLRQHYLLGREMAAFYPSIFNGSLKFDEFYVRSSYTQRTLNSATAHLLGLWNHFEAAELPFPNKDRRTLPPIGSSQPADSVNFSTPLPHGLSPSPIHSETVDEDDSLFLLSSQQCPKGTEDSKKVRLQFAEELNNLTNFERSVTDAISKYQFKSKAYLNTYEKCVELGDFALQDARNNPSPKLGPSDDLFRLISRCYETSIIVKYSQPRILKVAPAIFIEDLLGKLTSKKRETGDKMKYYLYTAHDSTLGPLLALMGLLDVNCFLSDLRESKLSQCLNFPDTAANIVFELIRDSGKYYVRTRYNFSPVDFCSNKNGNEEFRCDFEDFEARWLSLIDRDWKVYCQTPAKKTLHAVNKRPSSTTGYWKLTAITILCASALLSVMNILSCIQLVRSKREKIIHERDSLESSMNDSIQ